MTYQRQSPFYKVLWFMKQNLRFGHELLANDVSLTAKILLDNEEALWRKKWR